MGVPIAGILAASHPARCFGLSTSLSWRPAPFLSASPGAGSSSSIQPPLCEMDTRVPFPDLERNEKLTGRIKLFYLPP